jgi:sugar/nucleoside kinase (ribokinase family)
MADVVVLGTAAADVIIRVDHLPAPGDHLAVMSLGWRLGGGAVNFACGVAAAGHQVELVGAFGSDEMADRLVELVHAHGVGTTGAFRAAAPSPRALILLDPGGERTILGLDHELAAAAYPVRELPSLDGAACVWVETYSRFPLGVADRVRDGLLVAPPPGLDATAWPADLVIGSERQLPPDWGDAPLEPLRRLSEGRLRWAIVTRGARGADAYGVDGSIHVEAASAHQVDSTGAGDAFAAALVAALLHGCDMEGAMVAAADAGAAAVGVLQSVPPAVEVLDGP